MSARPRTTTVIGWVAFALSCAWVVVGLVSRDFTAMTGQPPDQAPALFVADALYLLAFTGIGALFLSREPDNKAALLCLFPVLSLIPNGFYAAAWWTGRQDLYEWVVWTWFFGSAWSKLSEGFVALLLLLTPNGRVPDRRWRPVAMLVAGAMTVSFIESTVLSLVMGWGPTDQSTTLWWEDVSPYLQFICEFIIRAGSLAGLLSLLHRLNLARGRERAQIAWVFLGAAVWMVAAGFPGLIVWNLLAAVGLIGSGGLGWIRDTVSPVGVVALPMAYGVAILRYRLVELNPLLRRLLLVVVMVMVLTGAYLALRALLGEGSAPAGVTAVGLALVSPVLYRWLRGGVTRLVYGRRGSPADMTAALTRRMAAAAGPSEVLAALADTACNAVPGGVEVVLTSGGLELMRVSRGTVTTRQDQHVVPLTFQSAKLGRMEIEPHSALDPADHALLVDLAAAASAAVAAAHRSSELLRARQELITAREQERRRIARDLHDGVGPVLSGLGFTLDSLRASVHDPAAMMVAGQARGQVRDAVQLVRRVARELRPPGVDQLGLIGALRELAAQHTGVDLTVQFAAAELGELNAATEVAVHAIVAEALTNTARHAHATRCSITLDRGAAEVTVVVQDNGTGIMGAPPGVGSISMIERADELGGWCQITSNPGGGTIVTAHLPVHTFGDNTNEPTRPSTAAKAARR